MRRIVASPGAAAGEGLKLQGPPRASWRASPFRSSEGGDDGFHGEDDGRPGQRSGSDPDNDLGHIDGRACMTRGPRVFINDDCHLCRSKTTERPMETRELFKIG